MSAAELAVVWQGGGAGRVVSLAGDAIVLRSSKPFAPGSRPEGTLGTGDTLRVKTHRCRRDEGGDGLGFTLDGRALDMSRALRERIAALLAPQP